MSLLLVARHGLSSDDLADMLSAPPALVWRFLFVAVSAEQHSFNLGMLRIQTLNPKP
jgi:hypothetical protein